MAFLFISFTQHLNVRKGPKQDLYSTPLEEQFLNLQKRVPAGKKCAKLQDFIETCFPSGMLKDYSISCPNFLRERRNNGEGKPTFLNNVVIRPKLSLNMRQVLPNGQNVILIGDICETERLRSFQVKGIEFIDENMSSPHDTHITASACHSFEWNIWTVRADSGDSLFTPNFILELIDKCYTVSNPEEIRKTYEEWNKYIQFRNYYLEEQAKRNFRLDSCEYIDSYAVNRKDYKKYSYVYDDFILDGVEEFKKGEMVVLSSKVEAAEPFPLIKLTIDRNKKKFEEAKIYKGNKKISEEERRIRSLASDNVIISQLNPDSPEAQKNGHTDFYAILGSGYELGDRFRIVARDVEPTDHLEQLDAQYERDIKAGYETIDAKYSKVISDELEGLAKAKDKEIANRVSAHIKQERKRLDDELEGEVKTNSDPGVIRRIEKEQSDIKSDLSKSIKKVKKEDDNAFKKRMQEAFETACSQIDVRGYYIERNENLLQRFSSKLIEEGKKELSLYKSSKDEELKNKYSGDIRGEKIAKKEELDAKLKADKEKAIEEETIRRFSLYFRLGDPNNEIKQKQKDTVSKCKYIVYDSRAERAKIKRQQAALENFYSGFVKNPYLSTYLFNPESLAPTVSDYSNWMWYLESLNEKQKEAVRKAVASNGVFLLQGPPGTGKTQVIAETVAQMVKKGKKVLISSETHKAIDNVFERLPKIAEIVPVRLIPSNRKNDNDYDPKFLVDNFYKNISSNMLKAVDRYEHFSKNKEEFKETFEGLQLLKSKIDKHQAVLDEANEEVGAFEKQAKAINSQISTLNDKRDSVQIRLDSLRRTSRHIDKNNLNEDEDIKVDVILSLRKDLKELFSDSCFAELDDRDLLKNLCSIKPDEVERELSILDPNASMTRLELERDEIKNGMKACKDEFDDVLPEKEEDYKRLRKRLIEITNEINNAGSGESLSDLKLKGIFKYAYLTSNVSSVKEQVEDLKNSIAEIKAKYIEEVSEEISQAEAQLKNVDVDIEEEKVKIRDINDRIIEIQERDDVQEIQKDRGALEGKINQFFRDFEIAEPYNSIEEALKIIGARWEELSTDFAKKEAENKEKIPMYREISNYLTMDEVIEEDRKTFTRDLFESANVFGITCTSNDRFSGKNVSALSDYNIEDVDIKTVGIDVVIIDEVSKSSFIDLLIPILYGKTVILVGDHRQLPPMYEFAKLRDDDFDGLDENIINKEINEKFTKLYEECFFKTLFERIPDSYKTMLIQQYRCHEQIMDVFNSFYQGELKLGFSGQNNAKKHNIRLISNGRTIIEPDKHIYFIDCKGKETHEQDSTSMYNTGEAEVVAALIRKLNDYLRRNPDPDGLSIGVICTYGDQARKIKEVLKREKVKTDAFKTDSERMIISTVDDFQGDERDIIILSTVRNPENPARSNPGFILAYQRINVALSRARKMLVMVGNRKYLEDKGVIDLPDVHGKGKDRHNFRVYEEIIATIERRGKVIDDVDVLDEKEAKING